MNFSSDVMVKDIGGEAGLLFRVSSPGNRLNDFKGYYAGIDKRSNSFVLVKSDGRNTETERAAREALLQIFDILRI